MPSWARYLLCGFAAFAAGALLTAGVGNTFAAYSDFHNVKVSATAKTWPSGCNANTDAKPGDGRGAGSGNQGSDDGTGNGSCDNGYGKTGCPRGDGSDNGNGNGSCTSHEATAANPDAATTQSSNTASATPTLTPATPGAVPSATSQP